MARPTKYNSKTNSLAEEYLETFDKDGDVIPTIEGLGLRLGITRETVYDWIKQEEKQEFSYIVCKILQKQANILVNKGLSSDFNASITKLMLTKHGYVDKQETEAFVHLSSEEWLDELD